MSEYTATLNDWTTQELSDKTMIVWGSIENDELDRWCNGTWIHTSETPIADLKEGDIVVTRNNKYLLGTQGKFTQ